MLRHHRRITAAIAAALTAASIVVSGALAASATTRASGTEHFQLANTSATATTAPLVAYGVFTESGVDHLGSKVDTFVFADGTFKVAHSPGKGTHTFNPKTCLFVLNVRGTYTVGHGTGAYAGISGHGAYHTTILEIGARSGGKCTQSQPPTAFQQIITASGPVQL